MQALMPNPHSLGPGTFIRTTHLTIHVKGSRMAQKKERKRQILLPPDQRKPYMYKHSDLILGTCRNVHSALAMIHSIK